MRDLLTMLLLDEGFLFKDEERARRLLRVRNNLTARLNANNGEPDGGAQG